jgi:ornithine cyclodeaminase/alanine dehydrogenase-like protein (mu-crystallin family)
VTTLLLTRRDVAQLLDMDACIDAVEHAFRAHADGRSYTPGVLGTHVPGGGFHVKTAGVDDRRRYFAAKVNANFPGNPAERGLPTIQGVIALFDAEDGRVLAVMDSMEVTSVRTAAATAVAAKHLARADAATVTICGCGEQGRSQLRALARVRALRTVYAFDLDAERAGQYALTMSRELGVDVAPAADLADATRRSDICVTCTPARRWFIGRAMLAPGGGAFVAAVGADAEQKQEIDPELLASSTVVVDVLDQCASIGDLHHAIVAGLMIRGDVHADLADVVSGRKPGRTAEDEIIIFDSTGTALEDVAAAALVFERAVERGLGMPVDLGSSEMSRAGAIG